MRSTQPRRWALAVLLVVLVGSSHAQKIETAASSDYKLSELKTFAFAPLELHDPLTKNPALAKQIRDEVVAGFRKIGLRQEDAHPDFLVAYTAGDSTYESSYSTGVSGGSSTSEVWSTTYHKQTVTLDFVDPRNQAPIWHGTATRTVAAGTMDKYVPKAVRKIGEAFHDEAEKQKKGKG